LLIHHVYVGIDVAKVRKGNVAHVKRHVGCRMSWTLTPQFTTLVHGLVAYPSTLLQLADAGNALLPDFFDAQIAEGRIEFPQILIADHFQSSYLVPMTTRINRIRPCLGTAV
jgi:hypothetical protein